MTINSRSAKLSSPNAKVQDVPNKPTIGTLTQGAGNVYVPFTPATTGGNAAVYRAVSNPGNIEAISYGSSPITVPGLSSGTSYTFTLRGETSTGATSGYTAASPSITPAFDSYELITTTTLSSSQSSVTFDTSTLSDYKHLQIRAVSRTDAGGASTALLRFNGNSSSSYARHYLAGNGSSVSSGGSSSTTAAYAFELPNSGAPTNNFGAAIIEILDPFSTSKNKTVRSLNGYATSSIGLYSGAWFSTSSVTSITFFLSSGNNFVANSRFSLYGIKG